MRSFERIIDGLTLVLLGFILLGSTLGYLPWSIGATIAGLLSLWPVLLVTVGIEIIGRALNISWLRVLSSVVILLAVAYGGLVLPANQSQPGFLGLGGLTLGSSRPFQHSAPLGSVEQATIAVKGGAGRITLDAGDAEVLAKVSGESPFGNPSLDVARSGNSADVIASLGSGSTVWPLSGRARMDVRMSPAVTWDVMVETGANTLEGDFRDLPVKALLLKTGASSSDITLGQIPSNVGEVPVRIESGVASVSLRLPTNVEIRVEAETGLSSVNVPDDVRRQSESGRVFQSPGYDRAKERYVIHVQTGLGSVNVERY